MSENFNTWIERINVNAWRDLCVSHGTLRHFNKGEEFVSVGYPGRYFGWIQSGTLKYVVRSEDGAEHVVGFVFNEEFVADWHSIINETPSEVSIIATSDCDIYCIPSKEIIAKLPSDAYVREMVSRATEAVYSTIYHRYLDLYVKTPQQRYESLISRHPDLFDRFSLKDIASFLHVTPTHLSRLRKK